MIPTLTRLEVVEALPGEFGQPITVLPWWRELLEALDDPALMLLIVLLTRQSGKSQSAFHMGASELLTRRNAFVLYVAAAEHQAGAVFERKLRAPFMALLKAQRIAPSAVRFTKRGVEVPSLGSALEIVPANAATTPGRSPTLLIFDEARDIPDNVFTALAPSVIGASGKVLIASTTGPPRGFLYDLCQQAASSPETWLYRSAENLNPRANQDVLAFLRRKLGALFPAAMRRELEGEFADDGDELIAAPLIEGAIDDQLGEVPEHQGPAFAFLDLSRKRDLTSLVTVVRVDPRVPEAADHLLVASVMTWNPRHSPTGEVQFAEVRSALERLPRRFPNLQKIRVDEGAEAGSILPWARAHPTLSLRVEGFTGSVASNMDIWSALLARLNAGTLSIPRHQRLLAELRGLRRQEFAFGSKWRVVDASRKYHRDVSLSLAGAVFGVEQNTRSRCPYCDDPACGGLHLLDGAFLDARARALETRKIRREVEAAGVRDVEAEVAQRRHQSQLEEQQRRAAAEIEEDRLSAERDMAMFQAGIAKNGCWFPGD